MRLINADVAVDVITKRLFETAFNNVGIKQSIDETLVDVAENRLENWFDELPSIQPERTEYFPDTIAIPSQSDCVCLSEKVTATFFDEEHEEWTQQTVTIADVLDSVCDEYTVLPSAQPEHKTGRWIESNPQDSKLCRLMTCSECGKAYIVNINVPYEDWTEAHKFCVECGTDMRGKQDGR